VDDISILGTVAEKHVVLESLGHHKFQFRNDGHAMQIRLNLRL
jgi:hypothetical protein